jgi:hypothetical protein
MHVSVVSLTPLSRKVLISRIAVLPLAGVFKNVSPAKGKGVLYLKEKHDTLFLLIIEIAAEMRSF